METRFELALRLYIVNNTRGITYDGSVVELPSGQVLFTLPNDARLPKLSPDGSRVAAIVHDNTHVYDIPTGVLVHHIHEACDGLSMSDDTLVCKIPSGLRIWRLDTMKSNSIMMHILPWIFTVHGNKIYCLYERHVSMYDIQTPLKRTILPEDKSINSCMAVDGNTLVTGCINGAVRVWNLETGTQIMCLWHPSALYLVALNHKYIVTQDCGDDIDTRIWDRATGARLHGTYLPGRLAAVADGYIYTHYGKYGVWRRPETIEAFLGEGSYWCTQL